MAGSDFVVDPLDDTLDIGANPISVFPLEVEGIVDARTGTTPILPRPPNVPAPALPLAEAALLDREPDPDPEADTMEEALDAVDV